jgi:hypothetical protein
MQRTQSLTRKLNLFGAGKHGFTEGDPTIPEAATVVGMESMNSLQEEVAGIVEGAGIALNGADNFQALKAVRRLAGGNVTTLSVSTVLTLDQCGLILINASTGSRTLTLPAAAALAAANYTIARTDTNTANTVTVQAAAGDTAGGATSFTVPVGGRVRLIADGVNAWYRPGAGAPLTGSAYFALTPVSGQTYARALSFVAPTRGRVLLISSLTVTNTQPAAITNTVAVNGLPLASDGSYTSGATHGVAIVEAGTIPLLATLTVGASGSGFNQIGHQISYLFVPEIG